jgi:hypothetical protein
MTASRRGGFRWSLRRASLFVSRKDQGCVGKRCTVRQEPQRSTLYASAGPTCPVETMLTDDSLRLIACSPRMAV